MSDAARDERSAHVRRLLAGLGSPGQRPRPRSRKQFVAAAALFMYFVQLHMLLYILQFDMRY